jgi:hypothetical protein
VAQVAALKTKQQNLSCTTTLEVGPIIMCIFILDEEIEAARIKLLKLRYLAYSVALRKEDTT